MHPPPGYRSASLALALPYAGYTVARALRDGGGAYARGRLGLAPRTPPGALWVHCASVGEVGAALPFVQTLADDGVGPLLLSTATPTGHRVATRRAPDGVAVVYLPLDRPGPVRRFLARTRPRAAVIVETELWPWLYAGLAESGVPIVIVNGRLTARTLDGPRWWRAAAAFCLERVTAVLARSETDAAHFRALGASAERVRVVGNLKFAAPAATAAPIALGQPFVLAASTHDDEELRLARAWREAGRGDGHLLVIAPRHPGRGESLARALAAAGLAVCRRSEGETPVAATDVYLADTLGELPALMAAAEVVVMGGSLIARGGQNVLEPARAGRPIVTGPHMDNFRDETALLEEAGALQRRADAAGVIEAVGALLDDPARRAAMGERAQAALAAEADVAGRYRSALREALGGAFMPPAAR